MKSVLGILLLLGSLLNACSGDSGDGRKGDQAPVPPLPRSTPQDPSGKSPLLVETIATQMSLSRFNRLQLRRSIEIPDMWFLAGNPEITIAGSSKGMKAYVEFCTTVSCSLGISYTAVETEDPLWIDVSVRDGMGRSSHVKRLMLDTGFQAKATDLTATVGARETTLAFLNTKHVDYSSIFNDVPSAVEIRKVEGFRVLRQRCGVLPRQGCELDLSDIAASGPYGFEYRIVSFNNFTPWQKARVTFQRTPAKGEVTFSMPASLSIAESSDGPYRLRIAKGANLGYLTSLESDRAERVSVLGTTPQAGTSISPFICDAAGTCEATIDRLASRETELYLQIFTQSGANNSSVVKLLFQPRIELLPLSHPFPMSTQRAFTLTIPADRQIINDPKLAESPIELTIDGEKSADIDMIRALACSKLDGCQVEVKLKSIQASDATYFRYRIKRGEVSSYFPGRVDLIKRPTLVVKDQTIQAQKTGDLLSFVLQAPEHIELFGAIDTTMRFQLEFGPLPNGITLSKTACEPRKLSCWAYFKVPTDFRGPFDLEATLRPPVPVPAIGLPGKLRIEVDEQSLAQTVPWLRVDGLFPDPLDIEEGIFELKPFEHYFDREGDLAKLVTVTDVRGLEVHADNCQAGVCSLRIKVPQNPDGRGEFTLQITTGEGINAQTSAPLKVSLYINLATKRLSALAGTPLMVRIGQEDQDFVPEVTTSEQYGLVFSCAQTFWGFCIEEWKCSDGICTAYVQQARDNPADTSEFTYKVTRREGSPLSGKVIITWRSAEQNVQQRSSVQAVKAGDVVDVTLSAAADGQVSLPAIGDYVITAVERGAEWGGRWLDQPAFSCFNLICKGRFQIDSDIEGTQAAAFQFKVVAFSQSLRRTIRPRQFAAVSFNVAAADPRGRAGLELDPTLTLSGTPPAILQDLRYEFTPTVSGLQPGDSFVLSEGPSWMRLDTGTGRVSGIKRRGRGPETFKIAIQRNGRWVAEQGFTAEFQSDPLKEHAWHLDNRGQTAFAALPGIVGADINLRDTLARGITGRGIRVAVSDSGLDMNHEDLKANINRALSKNYACVVASAGCDPNDPTPTSVNGDHGTSVAGLIAAVGWNGLGSRGVAPRAELLGLNFLEHQNSEHEIDQYLVDAHILNMSWGKATELQFGYQPLSSESRDAIETALQRKGTGTILVKAAGNSFENYGNANFDAGSAHRGMINVAALAATGLRSSYSSVGANLWIAAPGGEYGGDEVGIQGAAGAPAMVTTDLSGCASGYARSLETHAFDSGDLPENASCHYTSRFNGTSSAAPVTSGVIALMLEANPKLTWRDVKHILASTARKVDEDFPGLTLRIGSQAYLYEQAWQTNQAGYSFHNWYGFGAIDADAAVLMAQQNYQLLGPEVRTAWLLGDIPVSRIIPDAKREGLEIEFELDSSQDLVVESIELQVNVQHKMPSDVGIELTSPTGTTFVVLNVLNSNYGTNMADILFLVNGFYGERAAGTWKVRILDGVSGIQGQLEDVRLMFNGRKS